MTSLGARIALAAAVGLATVTAVVYAAARDGDEAPARLSQASWAALTPSPLERTEVGAARVGDRIYVVGGYISSGGTTARMVRYEISADRWEEVAPMPIAVNHPGITAFHGHVYVLGGNLGSDEKSRRLYRYDPEPDRWKRLRDAPTARAALALAGIGHRLYAAGGYTAEDSTVQRLEIYDLESNRWTVGPKMPTGRNHVGAAIFKRGLVVTGGRPGPEHGGLTTVERYDPARNRWSSLPNLTTARSGHATVTVGGRLGGRIVVFGGEELDGGTTIEQVELFDPRDGGWTALPEMITPRHGVGGAARGGRIYALEGGPQPGLAFSSALEYLDLP
jgi:N-acetylneuraminic acid mutarotase